MRFPRTSLPWILAALLWPAILPFPYMNNTGQFSLMAWRWSEGDVLYRDIADNRPPATYAVWRLALAVFGMENPHVLLEMVLQCGTLALTVLVARRFWGPSIALRAGVLYVLSAFAYLNPDWLGESETIAMPMVLATIWIAGAARERARVPGPGIYAALGAIAGTLIAVKLVPAAIPLAAAGWLLVERRHAPSPVRAALLAAAGFGAGLVASTLPWFVYLHFQGGLPQLLRLFIDWGGPPTDVSQMGRRLLVTGPMLVWGMLYLIPAGILALLGLARLRRAPRVPADRLLLVCLLAGLFTVALQNLWYGYHFLVCLPPLVLLGARWWELARASDAAPGTRAARIRGAVLATVLILSPFVHRGGKWFGAIRYVTGIESRSDYLARFAVPEMGDPEKDEEAARWLSAEVGPDERTLMWGFSPHVFYQARRRPASRFIEHYPYACDNCSPTLRAELMASLRAEPPARVLVKSGELNRSEFHGRRATAGELLIEFTELHAFLQEHYEPAGTVGLFDVLRPRGLPPAGETAAARDAGQEPGQEPGDTPPAGSAR